MARKKISNEFMEKILTDSGWKSLSENFQWTEQWLEKYKDVVDWKGVSDNRRMLWTPSMLEKFKKLIDWKKLSNNDNETILTEECLERFKDYWDWSVLSENIALHLDYPLIDKFIDQWDWSELINRWGEEELYGEEFLERYIDHIPSSKLQDSHLWIQLVENRTDALKQEIIV